ncbi:LOW QUALITY PROTEIN: probable E3 ubiquitin-protein ligase HERC4 [Myiozetetes cayanensis]|uniref:LOW QUALITY PROTEIN: probable E3 ubiquitin-protein ligase HERC4 n=1 Tax=Myiozetetes cayanensis TaxID=478635 RepID=UPI0021610A21|nr:LOW QUALITY PROTEIN: probable E3 ubiquitin-protein ligase HERC4 [Myiozetetes cayanensis]
MAERRRRGQERGSREHTQSQRNEVQCSNHDETHKLILSHDGKVSEHWAKAPANCSKLRLVKELGSLNIVQIACGGQHAMALSRGGELFTWGQNTHGQLGLGSQTTFIPQAQLVERLRGVPLAQIAAGGAHSTTVSLSGAVYSWGKNDFGQLGLGDTEDRDCPSYVGALEHWKTVFISCGADHTAVLSKEGLVCTFGAGGAGQLGHNSTRNELMPRVVAELWGARASRVACGRQHTLVYVHSLDKFYFFGSDDERQPQDKRKPNHLIPLPIDPPVKSTNSCQENNRSQKGIKITAGVTKSFVLCKENWNSYLNGIATLKDKNVDEWISNYSSKVPKRVKKNIRLIFSSEACINGSFLQERDKHFKTSKEFSGVDISEVKCFYNNIIKKPELFQEVRKKIDNLLPSLSSSPISPENLRVYLILPFILQGEDGSSYHSLRLLAKAIMKLQPEDLQTLACLCSNLETSFFKELVSLYQRVSQENLSQFIKEFQICGPRDPFNLSPDETLPLQILQMLYQVNSRTGFRVEESNFYVPDVKEIIIFCQFFNKAVALWTLSKYPCIFDTQDRMDAHRAECQVLFTEQCRLSEIFTERTCTYTGDKWEFHVRRECFLQDIWNNLERASTQEFRRTLKVVFVGEQGWDDGGLSQELFTIAARTLCQPGTSTFRHFPSGLVWFPSKASGCEDKDTFFRIGTLCGMALFNQRMVPIPFPRAFYKKLLGLAPTLEDLEELLPTMGRILWGILNEECDRILESMDIDFTIMEEGDSMDVVELKKNGTNIPVTKDNRKEYVDLYVNYVFNESVQKPFQDFMRGFLRGCPARNWKMFLPAELQVVLQGHTAVDWHLLEKNVVYRMYNKSDKTIQDFWNVFHELPEEKKKMFLGFLSGSDRIPGYRLECFGFVIVDALANNPDELYPSANTCSLVFFLPRYSSKSILKEKLLYAIEHNEGFGYD